MRAGGNTIEARHRVPRRQRILLMVLTLAGWAYYCYLAFPLLRSTALPLLGALVDLVIPDPARVVPQLGTLACSPVDLVLLSGLAGTSLCMAVLLLTWAEAQRRRFTGVERRQRSPDIPLAEVAAALGASSQVVEVLGSHRVVTLRMRPDGTPEHAEAVLPGVTDDELVDVGRAETSHPLARIPLPRRPLPTARHRNETVVPVPVRDTTDRTPRHRAGYRSP